MKTKLWEKQKKETLPAFEAFQTFRDMGNERSIRKVAKALGKSETLIGRWSSKHRWQKRISAWVVHIDTLMARQAEKDALEANKRHGNQAKLLIKRAYEKIKEMTPAQVKKMSATDALRFMTEGTKMERESLGIPTYMKIDKTVREEKLAPWQEKFNELDDDIPDE